MKLLALLLLLSSSTALAETWPKTIAKYSVIDHKLTAAIIKVESNNDPKAVSRVGAKGLMQVTEIALRDVRANRKNLPASCSKVQPGIDLFNPRLNILAGSCYFKLLEAYVGPYLNLQIVSYNAGPGRVNDWIEGRQKFLPRETIDYLTKVMEALNASH